LSMRLTLFLISLFIFTNLSAQNEQGLKLPPTVEAEKTSEKRLEAFDELFQSYKYGQFEKQVQLSQVFKKWLDKQSESDVKLKANVILAELAFDLNQYDKFLQLAEKLIAVNFQNTLWEERKDKILTMDFFLKNNLAAAERTINSQLKKIQGKSKNRRLSEWSILKSELKMFNNDRDSAYFFANQTIQFGRRSDSKNTTLNGLYFFALIQVEFENYDEAINKLLQLSQFAKEQSSIYFQFKSNLEIAKLSANFNNYQTGFSYLKKCEVFAEKLNDRYINNELKVVKSLYDVNNGNLNLARTNLVDAYFFFKSRNDSKNLIRTLLTIAELDEKNSDYESKLDKLLQSQELLKKENSLLLKSTLDLTIGKTYFKLGKYEQAFTIFQKVANYQEKYRPNSVLLMENDWWLSKYYELKGDNKSAYKYLLLYLENEKNNSILSSASSIEKQTENNLREEREKLIQAQNESIAQQEREKEVFKLKRDRQLFIVAILVVLMILAFAILIARLRQQRLIQQQREMELSQSLLRTQMNPHFIFNAMSVIQSSIYTDEPAKTSKFLVNFSKLIRLILENSPKEFITLELENEILEKYLLTQKMRFENRFNYSISIEENLIHKHVMVPPMITQPFVENAIEHGQLHQQENGKIDIVFSEVDGMLSIEIKDNGVGRKQSQQTKKIKNHKSMAIDITTDRIHILNKKYNKTGKILIDDLDKQAEIGTLVQILLPLHIETT